MIQRGNCRQKVFFKDEDKVAYLRILKEQEEDANIIRLHGRTGRPLGEEGFIKKLEGISGRILGKRKPGPNKRN